jgi:prolipoprotein diacylglyceryltransferase
MTAYLPSPPSNGFHFGPLFFHAYGLAYVVAVIAAVAIIATTAQRPPRSPRN